MGTRRLFALLQVSVRISAAERDALYEQIHARLSGIDEVWQAAGAQDWETADEVAREFADNLRLIVDDLGWGEGGGEPLELITPPDVLRRVLTRVQGKAEEQLRVEEEERTERQHFSAKPTSFSAWRRERLRSAALRVMRTILEGRVALVRRHLRHIEE
jgi:hypothetical protein